MTLKFKPVTKDRLFYDKFEYSISFKLQEVSCLRELNHDYITSMIKRRREWREAHKKRMASFKNSTLLSNEITEVVEQNLHKLADILLLSNVEFKLVVSTDFAWVYTNDVALIEQLAAARIITSKTYTRAKIDRPKNTIRLKNAQHRYRSYFKLAKLTAEQKANLINFLANQHDSIRLSPALVHWTTINFLRTQDYFFVDHDEITWLTMLGLVNSGLIRKTLEIIPAK